MADKPVRAPLSVKEHKQLLKASELLDDKKFKACLKLVDELVKERKPAEVHGSVIALKGLCMVKSSQGAPRAAARRPRLTPAARAHKRRGGAQ